mmetsp:Transcript_42177/g.83422  ORF Transcript_42177/g.83422 Transcript_42177/m.83422 type:complete len:666 (+) Transcript_42177:1792-3789(+)
MFACKARFVMIANACVSISCWTICALSLKRECEQEEQEEQEQEQNEHEDSEQHRQNEQDGQDGQDEKEWEHKDKQTEEKLRDALEEQEEQERREEQEEVEQEKELETLEDSEETRKEEEQEEQEPREPEVPLKLNNRLPLHGSAAEAAMVAATAVAAREPRKLQTSARLPWLKGLTTGAATAMLVVPEPPSMALLPPPTPMVEHAAAAAAAATATAVVAPESASKAVHPPKTPMVEHAAAAATAVVAPESACKALLPPPTPMLEHAAAAAAAMGAQAKVEAAMVAVASRPMVSAPPLAGQNSSQRDHHDLQMGQPSLPLPRSGTWLAQTLRPVGVSGMHVQRSIPTMHAPGDSRWSAEVVTVGAHMPAVHQPQIDTARWADGVQVSSPPRIQQPWAPHQLHIKPWQQQQQQEQQQQQLLQQQRPPQNEVRSARPPPIQGATPHLAQAADARQKARELQFELRLEMKHMERAMKKMVNEEARLQQRLRTEVQRGNTQTSQLFAKSVVQTKRAAARMQKTKASMQAVDLQVTESIASLSARNCVRLSAEALQQLGETVQLPELEQAVQKLHREAVHFARVEDAVDGGLGCSCEVEEVADAEVQKLLEELEVERHLQRHVIRGTAKQVVCAASTVPPAAAAFVPQTPAPPMCSPGRAALAARWPPARA